MRVSPLAIANSVEFGATHGGEQHRRERGARRRAARFGPNSSRQPRQPIILPKCGAPAGAAVTSDQCVRPAPLPGRSSRPAGRLCRARVLRATDSTTLHTVTTTSQKRRNRTTRAYRPIDRPISILTFRRQCACDSLRQAVHVRPLLAASPSSSTNSVKYSMWIGSGSRQEDRPLRSADRRLDAALRPSQHEFGQTHRGPRPARSRGCSARMSSSNSSRAGVSCR